MNLKPTFFIIGAPKCGTTALSEYLRSHPSVFISKPKEPHYFCTDLKVNQLQISSEQEYLDYYFKDAKEVPYKAIGEASVWYLYSKVAIPNILSFNSKAKFIVMVRHPVEMVYSLHSMLNFMGWEPENNFFNAWELQWERKKGLNQPTEMPQDQTFLYYQDVCSLGSQIERLYSFVSKEQVKVIFQEDFFKNTREVYLDILNFLEVEDDGKINLPRINKSYKIQNAVVAKTLRSKSAIKLTVLVKKILGLKTLGIGRPEIPLDLVVKQKITPYFEKDIILLESLTGRKLSHWLDL
jgi:hypothetical protein